MKIGILTYHRAHNYGALLQAIATRKILEEIGHEAYYVDYYPDYHKRLYAPFHWQDFRSGGIKYMIGYLLDIPAKKKRFNIFHSFIKKEVEPYCKPLNTTYDAVLYGSDQIWRKQPYINDYNPFYFACNNIKSKKHIAFSASMGVISNSSQDKKRICEMLSRFDHISVREDDLLNLAKDLGYNDTIKTIDPTLILSKQSWEKILPTTIAPRKEYLLLYELRKGFDESAVRDFASKQGLEIVKLAETRNKNAGNARKYDNPYEFVNLIRNARFVCTSSYHGMVFSIIYGKPFYVSFASNADRAASLLSQLDISQYLLQPQQKVLPEYHHYDRSVMAEKLETLQEGSIAFLKESIKENKNEH